MPPQSHHPTLHWPRCTQRAKGPQELRLGLHEWLQTVLDFALRTQSSEDAHPPPSGESTRRGGYADCMTWERILGMKASEQLDWLVNHTKPLKEWLERVQACSCAQGSFEVENGRPVLYKMCRYSRHSRLVCGFEI